MNSNFFARLTILAMLIGAMFAQDLYDINNISVIELTFESSSWDYQLDQLYAAGNEDRLLATAVINGIQFDSVGVRYKGNSTYSSNNAKNPLNIKLDYMISDQEYDNYGTLKLSNGYNDPSCLREVLSYEIARNYMPASLSNFAKVYINGTYRGLYSSTQDVDKYFVQTHFGERDNSFFKGELTNDNPNNMVTVWGYNGSLASSYSSYYELESDEGWNDLVDFLDTFNNDSDNMESVLNVDAHLWMLAFDNLLVNLDAPINFAHNYYLYQDNAGRFNPIVWDFNESFGVFSRLLSGSELSTSSKQQLSPYLHASSSYYPIIKNVLSIDQYKKMYVAHMKTIISDYFTDGSFRERGLELQKMIDEAVQSDRNKFYTYSQFINNLDYSITQSSGGRPGPSSSIVGLTQLMDARATYLSSLSDFSAQAPEFTNVIAPQEDLEIGDELSFSCDVASASSVKFCYRYSQNDVFTKIDMYDDGAHGDAASGDGNYGLNLTVNSNKIEYYFYAENDNAVSFSPEKAEYVFYELSLSGNLVINEFLADNETIIADNNDDYDDWIELYNNTENAIDLNGYYLSDNASNLSKWAFPDTSIEAYSYLIIWADDDEDNGELHANFKLSASGEAIYLVDPGESIVDEVIFGAQSDDISMGRYENAVGNFIYMTPTFSTENQELSESAMDDDNMLIPEEFRLEANYPNPFNPSTTLEFNLPEASEVSLNIYDMSGKLVDSLIQNDYCLAGRYSIQWNAQSFPSGVYIAVLQSGIQRQSQKMILLK